MRMSSRGRCNSSGVDDGQLDFVRTYIGAVRDRVIITDAQRAEPLTAARGL
jgi:hypothetical protein